MFASGQIYCLTCSGAYKKQMLLRKKDQELCNHQDQAQ